MQYVIGVLFYLLSINFVLADKLSAQPWTFVKEKDGIKIFTRIEPNSSLKSFRGEVIIHAPFERVCGILGNPKNNDWWDKVISDVKVLGYEEHKFIRYYLIYHLPWPFANRDLVSETRITSDPVTGAKFYIAKPLSGVVPEKPNLVRIEKYQQIWTVQPMDKGNVRVILEGSFDPGGNIPLWVSNMVITQTPFKIMHALRERVLSDKPLNK